MLRFCLGNSCDWTGLGLAAFVSSSRDVKKDAFRVSATLIPNPLRSPDRQPRGNPGRKGGRPFAVSRPAALAIVIFNGIPL